jgi:hypothetical protein
VKTLTAKRGSSRLITGTTASPSGTARAPPGQKSFCTSTTISAAPGSITAPRSSLAPAARAGGD